MKKVLVYGMGISGKGAVKLLQSNGLDIAIYDDNAEAFCDFQDIENRCGQSVKDVLKDISLLVVSPSVSQDNPIVVEAKAKRIEVIGELELAYRNCKADVLAVTGTNGKTTTVELLAKMLSCAHLKTMAMGNNGVCFSEFAQTLQPCDAAVVEVSSFQLETIDTFAPKIAICLNVTPDHLERHKDMEGYINCKRRIFSFQHTSDYAVLNYDEQVVREMAHDILSNTYYFSTKSIVKGAYVCAGSIFYKDITTELVCSINDIKLKGIHNLENALACITACKILRIPNYAIVKALNEFTAPSHRMEYIGEYCNAKYYNDSKATNISATLSACRCMVGKTTLILGGYDKGLSYEGLFEALPIKIATIIVYGANREKIIEDARKLNSLTVIRADDLEDAVRLSAKIVSKNVLFSPATSSYDSFANYMQRGNYFMGKVRELLGVQI